MKLLVIVLCLLSERFFIHSLSYTRFNWFADYHEFIRKKFNLKNFSSSPWLQLMIIILPLIIISTIILFVFDSLFFGIIGFILNIIIFYYCLGPQNPFYPLTSQNEKDSQFSDVGDYLADVNGQLFAVIFWYFVTGPVGIIAYRIVSLASMFDEVKEEAVCLTSYLNWIPARLAVILYLLVGQFQKGLHCFKNFIITKPNQNRQMLAHCGEAALDEVTISAAECLVEYALIVFLVVLAAFTILTMI